MATIVQDSFTDTNGVSLNAHTPETRPGSTMWTEQNGDWQITSNKAVVAVATNSAVATIDTGYATGITLACKAKSSTNSSNHPTRQVGLVLRYTNANNYWFAAISAYADLFNIYEVNNGVFTQRASTTVVLSSTTEYTIQVTLDGQTIRATVDGGNEISYSSASLNESVTVHGVKLRDVGDTIDDFLVETVEAGSVELTADSIACGTPSVGQPSFSVNPVTFTDGYGGNVTTAKDTILNSDPLVSGINFANHAHFEIDTGQVQLMYFDLSTIPSGRGCLRATLYFIRTDSSGNLNYTVTVHSIAAANANWPEGTKSASLGGAGDCCWNYKNQTPGNETPWAGSAGCSTSGVDYIAAPIGSWTGNSGDAIHTEYSCELDPAVIKTWFGSSNSNYGIRMSADIPGGHCGSSDATDPAERPRLVIVYSEAAAGQSNTIRRSGFRVITKYKLGRHGFGVR